MADRVLRGSRLGAVSYETERHTELAPRQTVTFECPRSHVTAVTMSGDADVPSTWECRTCGVEALRSDNPELEERKVKPQRTHWDMLLERRSIAELEEVLAERLDVLHQHRPKSA